jgi:hypothetical protein
MASSLGDNSPFRVFRHLKRHITSLQLAQFFGMLINNLISMYEIRAGRCKFYAWMAYALTFYLLSMIVLFSKFYFETYIAARRAAGVARKAAAANAAKKSGDATTTTTASPSAGYDLRRRKPRTDE